MQGNFLASPILEFGQLSFSWGQVLTWVITTGVTVVVYGYITKLIASYSEKHKLQEGRNKSIKILSVAITVLIWLILTISILDIDYTIFSRSAIDVKISGLVAVLCIILLARIADALISARILEEMENRHRVEILAGQYAATEQRIKITRLIQYSLINFVLIIAISLSDTNKVLHTFNVDSDNEITVTLISVLSAFLVVLVARVILWLGINLFLYGWYQRNRIDLGKQYAYNQLLSYVLYTFAVIIAMQYMGLNFTLLWAGAAALLVGIGIALQQVISDFFSGLVLLFERSVEVGDFLDLGDYAGTVKKIGLRASIVETLEQKLIYIPNSQLVNQNVVNLTSTRPVTRYEVQVGTAYGSDTKLVKQTLLDAVNEVQGIMKEPPPFVRFIDFGDSSLNFSVLFFSLDVMHIEDIKSDVRFAIDESFRERNIEIPFPQRDIWIKGKQS